MIKTAVFVSAKDTSIKGFSFSKLIDPLKNKWSHFFSRDTLVSEIVKGMFNIEISAQ
jgi:hypothetical protein